MVHVVNMTRRREMPMYPKILLVDDIQMFLEIQRNILKPLSVQIATAADGHEALGVVEQFKPDLIVLDMNMPRMDGIACCKALKQHQKHRRIPVIMTVSAFGTGPEPWRAAGCDAVLHKPLDAGKFLEAVTAFLPGIDRRSKRAPLLAPVVVRTGGRTFGGALINISRSGACLEPDERIELGAAVALTFHLNSSRNSTLVLRGSVVRLRSPDAHGMQAGVGVAFANTARLQELDAFIDGCHSLRQAEASPLSG